MRTYFHCCALDDDQQQLLDPSRHFTEPWGSSDHGGCDKCRGLGEVDYACGSCLERGAEPDCPACQGRVEFRGTCPACEGSGRIDRTRRRGLAVFPTREGLYRYLVERDAELEGRAVVELAGTLSPDLDLDADSGSLLLFPERVLESRPLDLEIADSLRRRLG